MTFVVFMSRIRLSYSVLFRLISRLVDIVVFPQPIEMHIVEIAG